MPNPKGNPESLKSFPKVTDEPLAKAPVCVKLTERIDSLVRLLPPAERSAWIRRVVTEAAEKELAEKPEE